MTWPPTEPGSEGGGPTDPSYEPTRSYPAMPADWAPPPAEPEVQPPAYFQPYAQPPPQYQQPQYQQPQYQPPQYQQPQYQPPQYQQQPPYQPPPGSYGYPPPGPPTPPDKPLWRNPVLWIGVVIALVVVIGLAIVRGDDDPVASSRGGTTTVGTTSPADSTQASSNPTSAATTSEQPTSAAPTGDAPSGDAAVGDSLQIESRDGLATITLEGLRTAQAPESSFGDPPQNGAFIVIDIRVEVQSGSYSANPLYFSYQSPDGNTYDVFDGNSLFAGFEPTLDSGDIPAGQQRRGVVTFDGPAPAAGSKLLLTDPLGGIIGAWSLAP